MRTAKIQITAEFANCSVLIPSSYTLASSENTTNAIMKSHLCLGQISMVMDMGT